MQYPQDSAKKNEFWDSRTYYTLLFSVSLTDIKHMSFIKQKIKQLQEKENS